MTGLINEQFKAELNRMEMLSLEGETSSLYFVADKENTKDPHIRIALEEAEGYEAKAVFFRIFPEDPKRSPLPQVFIYHDTALTSDKQSSYAEKHRRLWNAGIVPLMFILTTSEVKILNCRLAPDIDKATNEPDFTPFHSLEKILIANRSFAAREIASGTLWENPKFKNDFALENTAYYKLLSYLKAFREKLVAQKKLTKPVINRLLVMAILVKYLNDRRDSKGNRVFQDGFFCQFSISNTSDLASLFREQGSCIRLFDHLSVHFNGRIFELAAFERIELETADLSLIADFLEGTRDPSGQGLFWPLYSFDDLPVELISNIYEEFLAKEDEDNGKGVVYTPPMLVDFLLDQCLPLKRESLDWKILDPACGSGVFLVGAFKRLIHCWRIANDWKQPTHRNLQKILINNIFGLDKAPEAVLVTAFSLCVALCDELEPLVIWNELKFDDLRRSNLQAKDFFEIVESGEFDNHFNLIVGNPPFVKELTTEAAKRLAEKRRFGAPKLPGNQLALLFLEQAHTVCKQDGIVCLIQPAGPLLYNVNSHNFRKYCFTLYNVHSIFDFTALERVLFKAQVASAAVLAYKNTTHSDRLLHITFRRTKVIKEKILLEVDPYDLHWVSYEDYCNNPYVWKTNLLGGGRLHRLVKRFSEIPSFKEYLDDKQKKHGWIVGEGFKRGNSERIARLQSLIAADELSESEATELEGLKKSYKKAPYLTDKPYLPASGLLANGIDETQIDLLDQTFFDRPRSPEIYSPPHVLIREKVDQGKIPAVYMDRYLTFEREIFAIHASDEYRNELECLAKALNESSLPVFLASVFSGRYLVSRATALLKSDILSMPFASPNTPAFDHKTSFWEQALIEDVLNCTIEFCSKGEGAQAVKPIKRKNLSAFGEMFCDVLNPVYKQFRPLQPIFFGAFICYPFCYGDAPQFILPEESKIVPYFNELLNHQQTSRLFVNRILRIYEQNVIFMVKPNQKRYWLRSIALRDADETLIDLLEQGY
jgi:hypothetical protein